MVPAPRNFCGPMTPQTMLDEKKVLPLGHVKLLGWSASQIPGMFPRAQFYHSGKRGIEAVSMHAALGISHVVL